MRCSRNGCKREYDPSTTEQCSYHPGDAVFHEGLKSWSCCNEVNKPVLDFDDFLKISGCAQADSHITEATPAKPVPPIHDVNATKIKMVSESDGTETYGAPVRPAAPAAAPAQPSNPEPAPIPEEEDDPSVAITPGTTCRRRGCGKEFVSDQESRQGNGEAATCIYHPSPPLFREGSKGYLCCKRKVLEFDEFLKIPGCKTGRHVFAVKLRPASDAAPESITCRIDHYQTPREVIVSVFAKAADKERSTIGFDSELLHLDINLPGSKRFNKTLDLFGPINTEASSFQILKTKVEIKLAKLDGRSWSALEKSNMAGQALNFTFGVGGRTGTVGGKEIIVESNSNGGVSS